MQDLPLDIQVKIGSNQQSSPSLVRMRDTTSPPSPPPLPPLPPSRSLTPLGAAQFKEATGRCWKYFKSLKVKDLNNHKKRLLL
jgi:hypothetical protein